MVEVEFYNNSCGYSIVRYKDNVTLAEVIRDLQFSIDDRCAYVTVDNITYLVTKNNVERVYEC